MYSSSRACGLHFVETDYHDGGRQRKRQTTMQNRMLNQGSVPTKFDCFPERLRRPADDGKTNAKLQKNAKNRHQRKGRSLRRRQKRVEALLARLWTQRSLLDRQHRAQSRRRLVLVLTIVTITANHFVVPVDTHANFFQRFPVLAFGVGRLQFNVIACKPNNYTVASIARFVHRGVVVKFCRFVRSSLNGN